MKLTLLIPTIKKDKYPFDALMYSLWVQTSQHRGTTDVLTDSSETDTIGRKRNKLLERATTEYVAFIDSDDRISHDYISLLLDGIEKNVDCCSLKGIYSVDFVIKKPFLHYLACEKYHETPEAYHRYPNHLNCIRASIAKQFKFPEKNWGEDTDWATQIKKSGLLKTEHHIEQIIYYYDKRT